MVPQRYDDHEADSRTGANERARGEEVNRTLVEILFDKTSRAL
jgi:hypothetical protein